MATGVAPPSGSSKVIRCVEKKAWLLGRFALKTIPLPSFDRMEHHLEGKTREVETVLRLSREGLSWGKSGGLWRPFHNRDRPLPSGFVDLFALKDVFQENSKPEVLVCVAKTRLDHRVFVFGLYDRNDVTLFQRLFRFLTNGTGNAVPQPEIVSAAVVGRRALRHLIEKDSGGGTLATRYGDRTRHGTRRNERDREPADASNTDRNNNIAGHQQQQQPTGNQSNAIVAVNQPQTQPSQTENQIKQPSQTPLGVMGVDEEVTVTERQVIQGHPVPAPRKSKMLSRSELESLDSETVPGSNPGASEDPRRWSQSSGAAEELNFVWTRNLAYRHPSNTNLYQCVWKFDSDKPGARKIDTDNYGGRKIESEIVSQPHAPANPMEDTNSVPHDPMTLGETDLGEIKVTFHDEDTESVSGSVHSVQVTSRSNYSDGRVTIIVPDYSLGGDEQDGVETSHLKEPQNGPEPEVDPVKRKKILSFSPSVTKNGTAVTAHRAHRKIRTSVTDPNEFPDGNAALDPRHRNPVLVRGISVPVEATSGPFVTSNGARVRGQKEPETERTRLITWSGGKSREPVIIENDRQVAATSAGSQPLNGAVNVSKNRNSNMAARPVLVSSVSLPEEAYGGRSRVSGVAQTRNTDTSGSNRWWNAWRRSKNPPLVYASDGESRNPRRKVEDPRHHRGALRVTSVPLELRGNSHPDSASDITTDDPRTGQERAKSSNYRSAKLTGNGNSWRHDRRHQNVTDPFVLAPTRVPIQSVNHHPSAFNQDRGPYTYIMVNGSPVRASNTSRSHQRHSSHW